MQTYCWDWRRHSNNIASKKVTMTNKVTTEKSRCASCISDIQDF